MSIENIQNKINKERIDKNKKDLFKRRRFEAFLSSLIKKLGIEVSEEKLNIFF